MTTGIDIVADTAADLRSLRTWLGRVDGLAVDVVPALPRPGEQGAGWELLSVTFGSGGIGIVALRTIQAWLESRRSTITIKVKGAGADREVALDATNVADLMAVVEKMLDGPA